ncbi:hypothetical protein [Pelomonas cellulosilytica]|uniref:Uncharacterized protein n=1 Tax=Pelomonas cellulosilytica TaxID=2906762 RepID=A0ABS8Y3X5_9BURK|nr:hypothetical protein [Pelomonas sp. P8]MCE4557982.1 hypothetical protein [Pelomonas sp. P8]
MQLDLNNVNSIVAWWRVWPERHDSYLDYKLGTSPEFAPTIRAARQLIATTPELQTLRVQSLQAERNRLARGAELDAEVSARELRYRELAMA